MGFRDMELISIIISAYNIEQYISRCLDSVINQSYKNIDIVVVNDGSTDNTLNIIKDYSKKDNRINIINQDNKGLIEARKSGYKYSKGKYILFIDGDDWISHKAIEVLVKYIKEKRADIINYKCIYEYDNKKQLLDWDKTIGEFNEYEYLKECLLGKVKHNIWSQFIRKGFIEENKIRFPNNISYGEDLALTISLAINKPKVIVINEYLYHYYQRNSSLSNKISKSILEIGKATEFIKQELINYKIYEKFREEFEYMAFKQNFYSRRNIIFGEKNTLNKCIFNNWKRMGIKINRNKYYRDIYINDSMKAKIAAKIMERNYYVGKLVYRITGSC